MAIQPFALQARTAEINLPSQALAGGERLKALQNNNAMMAGEMQDKANLDQAYRQSGGDINAMLKNPNLGFEAGTKLQSLSSENVKAQAAAQAAKIDQGLKMLDAGAQIVGGANDQASWSAARQQMGQMFGADAMANLPEQFDPAAQKRLMEQSLSFKDKLELQRMDLQQSRADQQAYYQNARLDQMGQALAMRGQGGDDSKVQYDSSRGGYFDPNTRQFVPLTGEGGGALPEKTTPKKPMPASAAKLESEMVEDLTVAKGLQGLSDKYIQQLDNKEITLGAATNAMGAFSTKYGELPLVPKASDSDVKREGFLSDMKKLRNDSLRLNKGVQTDGDAQREWETLFANINNADVVKNTLSRINEINKRGEQLKRVQIDTQRENFSADPYNYERLDSIGGSGNGNQPKDFSKYHK